MTVIDKIKSLFIKNHYVNDPDPWTLPSRDYRIAGKNPYFRTTLIDLSIEEDEINSYYTGILNVVADACVGTVPMLLGQHGNNTINDDLEDRWLEWATMQNIGHALRECRRDACKTGIGILVPYIRKTVDYPIKLAFKNVPSTDLSSPLNFDPNVDIQNGIEYNENGDITAIWIKEDNEWGSERYSVPAQAIVWTKPKNLILPECGPAFCLFPSVRRFMAAIMRAEEFRSSIPLAVELDPMVYKPDDTMGTPSGRFEYEPGWVPTLPPGTKLTGVNVAPQGEERSKFIELVISAAARCKNMPKNIALGDSSNHNMASAQIDIEPWKNTVEIDRFDFEPLVRQVFKIWYEAALLVESYLLPVSRAASSNFTYSLNYMRLYTHPDPNKKANARMTDLISGSTTLYRIHTDEGRNPRRELDKEAQLLGVTRDDLNKMYLGARQFKTLEALKLLPEDQDNNENNKRA